MGGFAWVTLTTNDSYSLGALVLAYSLKQVKTAHKLVVLITPGVTEPMREKLRAVYDLVQEVNILNSRDEANLRLLRRPELGVTFTKLHCWRLTQFEKCVFLDADTMVVQNCDELFEREELSAAPDVGWPDCFNSGVFVYRPSNETFENLIQLGLEKGSWDGGDQGLLNLYFSDWSSGDASKRLPFIYNVCSIACYTYLPAFKQYGINTKIVHFIGKTKPWSQYFDTEHKIVYTDAHLSHITPIYQNWWNIFCSFVHPHLTTDMSGLAGVFAQLTLGAPRTAEQCALDDHLRRQGWEAGNIDYLGRDSFENIWNKICQTLSSVPSSSTTSVEPVSSVDNKETTPSEPPPSSLPSTVTTTVVDVAAKDENKMKSPEDQSQDAPNDVSTSEENFNKPDVVPPLETCPAKQEAAIFETCPKSETCSLIESSPEICPTLVKSETVVETPPVVEASPVALDQPCPKSESVATPESCPLPPKDVTSPEIPFSLPADSSTALLGVCPLKPEMHQTPEAEPSKLPDTCPVKPEVSIVPESCPVKPEAPSVPETCPDKVEAVKVSETSPVKPEASEITETSSVKSEAPNVPETCPIKPEAAKVSGICPMQTETSKVPESCPLPPEAIKMAETCVVKPEVPKTPETTTFTEKHETSKAAETCSLQSDPTPLSESCPLLPSETVPAPEVCQLKSTAGPNEYEKTESTALQKVSESQTPTSTLVPVEAEPSKTCPIEQSLTSEVEISPIKAEIEAKDEALPINTCQLTKPNQKQQPIKQTPETPTLKSSEPQAPATASKQELQSTVSVTPKNVEEASKPAGNVKADSSKKQQLGEESTPTPPPRKGSGGGKKGGKPKK